MSDELIRLQKLSLVSKVCEELQNHAMEDLGHLPDVAEFVIDLSKDTNTVQEYQTILQENEANFSSALAASIFNLIMKMDPDRVAKEKAKQQSAAAAASSSSSSSSSSGRPNAGKFFGLAIPDSAPMSLLDGAEEEHSRKRKQRDDDEPRYYTSDTVPSSSSSSSSSSASSISRVFPYRQGPNPTVGDRLEGEVQNIKDFGAFISLRGYAQPENASSQAQSGGHHRGHEGLLHASQIMKGKVFDIKEHLKRGQRVKVKIISMVGNKISVSMKDVDQATGQDLKPSRDTSSSSSDLHSNPSRPFGISDSAALRARQRDDERESNRSRSKRLSSPERWELTRLIASGVISNKERPDLDEEHGLVHIDEDDDEDEVEVELNEEEPKFLEGQTAAGASMSPIKMSQNMEGSLQRAALTQSALSKERRELREQQKTESLDAVPMDLSRSWEDPMAKPGERHLADQLRGIGMQHAEAIPAWKEATMGKNVTYGRATTMTIKEQRESLPIYKLREQLLQAVHDNQVLVVIGETGSGQSKKISKR